MTEKLTSERLHILQHALGLDGFGLGRSYRNHYCAGPTHDSFTDCQELVRLGLMDEHPPREIFGGDSCFVVTQRGQNIVTTESPQPPRVTRSKRRYLRFLSADCGMTFREWLQHGDSR